MRILRGRRGARAHQWANGRCRFVPLLQAHRVRGGGGQRLYAERVRGWSPEERCGALAAPTVASVGESAQGSSSRRRSSPLQGHLERADGGRSPPIGTGTNHLPARDCGWRCSCWLSHRMLLGPPFLFRFVIAVVDFPSLAPTRRLCLCRHPFFRVLIRSFAKATSIYSSWASPRARSTRFLQKSTRS